MHNLVFRLKKRRVVKVLLPILVLTCPAYANPDLDPFEWQQPLTSLGLGENNITISGCARACDRLLQLLPQREILPSDAQYFKVKDFFWSAQQAAVSPQCFVQPANTEDVSVIVKVAAQADCPFAVKAGGHAAFAGASNIQDGITIDLQLLNELTVSDDQTITRVGPGNRWIDVYSHLTPKNLSVVGGRVAEIGVGGLVLGGGISFFSGRFGWALDGVRNYEVVTASGELLDVNLESYPDLYWALRGGGNNFGIVTRFDMETFPQTGMWGGWTYASTEHNATLLDALHDFSHNAPQDVDAQAIVAIVWNPVERMLMAATQPTYARPVAEPEILKNFTKVPAFHNTLRLTDMTDLALELNSSNPNGLRQSYSTATFRADREMMGQLVDIFVEELETIKHIDGVVPALPMQIISKDIIARFARNGGNCLGIAEEDGPLVLWSYAVMWQDAADDELMLRTARRIVDRAERKAKELGVAHRYVYQNYADKSQEVMAGYGEGNLKRLKEISKKYDPEQMFQRLQPGYFKL